jgi:hypothetical protein
MPDFDDENGNILSGNVITKASKSIVILIKLCCHKKRKHKSATQEVMPFAKQPGTYY